MCHIYLTLFCCRQPGCQTGVIENAHKDPCPESTSLDVFADEVCPEGEHFDIHTPKRAWMCHLHADLTEYDFDTVSAEEDGGDDDRTSVATIIDAARVAALSGHNNNGTIQSQSQAPGRAYRATPPWRRRTVPSSPLIVGSDVVRSIEPPYGDIPPVAVRHAPDANFGQPGFQQFALQGQYGPGENMAHHIHPYQQSLQQAFQMPSDFYRPQPEPQEHAALQHYRQQQHCLQQQELLQQMQWQQQCISRAGMPGPRQYMSGLHDGYHGHLNVQGHAAPSHAARVPHNSAAFQAEPVYPAGYMQRGSYEVGGGM